MGWDEWLMLGRAATWVSPWLQLSGTACGSGLLSWVTSAPGTLKTPPDTAAPGRPHPGPGGTVSRRVCWRSAEHGRECVHCNDAPSCLSWVPDATLETYLPYRPLPAAALWCWCKSLPGTACQRTAGRSDTSPPPAHPAPPWHWSHSPFGRLACVLQVHIHDLIIDQFDYFFLHHTF